MALTRGKNVVSLPSGSNVGVNPPANTFGNEFAAGINLLSNKLNQENKKRVNEVDAIINNNKLKAEENVFQQKKDQKNQTEINRRIAQDQLAELKRKKEIAKNKAEQEKIARKRMLDNQKTLAYINLSSFEAKTNYENKNNPRAYSDAMQTYFEENVSKLDPELVNDYLTKYHGLYEQGYYSKIKEYDKYSNEKDYNNLMRLVDSNITENRNFINKITTPQELINNSKGFTINMGEVESLFSEYVKNHNTDKTMDDFVKDIYLPTMLDHDEALLKRFLINSNMMPNGIVAQLVLDSWAGLNPDIPEQYKEHVKFNTNILRKNTHDNWDVDNRDNIYKSVNSLLEDKIKQENEEKAKFNTNVVDQADEIIENETSKNLWEVVDPVVLEKNTISLDDNKNIIKDEKKLTEAKLKINDNERLKDSVNIILGNGSIVDALKVLEGTEYQENALDHIYEATWAISGMTDFTTNEFIFGIKEIIDGENTEINSTQHQLFRHMRKLQAMPNQFIETMESYMLQKDWSNEEDQNALISAAIIKNNILGTGMGNLPSDISDALNKVFTAYDKNRNTNVNAIESWQDTTNPDYKSRADVKEAVNKEINVNEDNKDFFDQKIIQAAAHHDTLSYYFYHNLINLGFDTMLRATGLEFDKGEGLQNKDLHNLMQDKLTAGFGFFNNVKMKSAAYTEYKKILYEETMKQLRGQENPSEITINTAIQKGLTRAIAVMSKNNYTVDPLLYDANHPNSFMLTTNDISPSRLTGLSSNDLRGGATAFLIQFTQNLSGQDKADLLGVDFASDEAGSYDRRLMSLASENKIKLQLDEQTIDMDNKGFHIWIKNAEGDWNTLKGNDIMPVTWTPNNRYYTNGGKTKKDIIKERAEKSAKNSMKIFGGPELDLESGNKIYQSELYIQEKFIQPLLDNWEEMKDVFQQKFGWDDNVNNTIDEMLTNEAYEINIAIEKEQQEMNITYKDDIEQLTVQHKKQYNSDISVAQINQNIKIYNDIYKDIGVVIHPAHQFVLQDIIEVMGTEAIGKQSKIYNHIKNERWALAKDEIQLMRHLFPDLSRFSALMMYWGNVVDR